MCKAGTVILLLLLVKGNIFCSLPDNLLGISLNSSYKSISHEYKLRKVGTKGLIKTFQIIYTDAVGIESYLAFFDSRVIKVKVVYNKELITEPDWENIFNQTKINYGFPIKSSVKNENGYQIETYLWEEGDVRYIIEKFSKGEEVEKIIITLSSNVEEKMEQLPLLKKIYLRIKNIF